MTQVPAQGLSGLSLRTSRSEHSSRDMSGKKSVARLLPASVDHALAKKSPAQISLLSLWEGFIDPFSKFSSSPR